MERKTQLFCVLLPFFSWLSVFLSLASSCCFSLERYSSGFSTKDSLGDGSLCLVARHRLLSAEVRSFRVSTPFTATSSTCGEVTHQLSFVFLLNSTIVWKGKVRMSLASFNYKVFIRHDRCGYASKNDTWILQNSRILRSPFICIGTDASITSMASFPTRKTQSQRRMRFDWNG